MSFNQQHPGSMPHIAMPTNPATGGQMATAPSNGAPRNTASPAGPSSSTSQKAPPPMRMRRKQAANPLVPNRRPGQKPNRPTRPAPTSGGAVKPGVPSRPANPHAQQSQLPQPIASVPIWSTPKSMAEGLRHHIMRMHPPPARPHVDLYDESQFTPPLRLHRRDPRAPAVGAPVTEVAEDDQDNPMDDKERERLEIMKEERKRIREENQAQIAPSQKKNRPAAFQKKTEQVYRKDDTPEQRKKQQLRYEESLPWHLEDFDNKNTWVGTYEAALSEHYVMLVKDASGFRLVPVEKWYRFTSKQRGKTWTAEQADLAFQAKSRAPRWFVEAEQKEVEKKNQKKEVKMTRKLHLGASDKRQPRGGGGGMGDGEDVGEMDYNAEEDFADDEEGVNGLFEGEDEDTKYAEAKIKKEQMGANVFELRDEKDVWKEEEEERKEAEERKTQEKKIRKALLKRERNYDYEDSDGNPYSSSSESLDSEEERQRDEEQKKEEEKKAKDKGKEPEKPKQTGSGASTKGTNTPIHISSGGKAPLKKPTTSLGKRPGSPNLSEASGNESSRKKAKKKHNLSQPTSGSRPMSPDTAPSSSAPNSKLSKVRSGAGSGSESDMTEGGRKQKLKLRLGGSPNGTPGGSRAASPAGGSPAGGSPVLAANRVPGTPASGTATPVGGMPSLPSKEEVLAAVPAQGMSMGDFLKRFAIKGLPAEQRTEMTVMMRTLFRIDKGTKTLFRK